MKSILAAIFFISALTINAQTASVNKNFSNRLVGVVGDEAIEKQALLDLFKNNRALSKGYNANMISYYDFLDKSQVATINDLVKDDLFIMEVLSNFRIGQGDYTYCDINKEVASFSDKRVIVAFNTRYKRENAWGFWAVVDLSWNWCHDDQTDDVFKAKLNASFVKWVKASEVSALVFQ